MYGYIKLENKMFIKYHIRKKMWQCKMLPYNVSVLLPGHLPSNHSIPSFLASLYRENQNDGQTCLEGLRETLENAFWHKKS